MYASCLASSSLLKYRLKPEAYKTVQCVCDLGGVFMLFPLLECQPNNQDSDECQDVNYSVDDGVVLHGVGSFFG